MASYFLDLCLAITHQTLRLVGYSKSLKLQNGSWTILDTNQVTNPCICFSGISQKTHPEVNLPNLHFFSPNFHPKTTRSDFIDRILFLGIPAVGEAQKPDWKG